MYIKNMSIKNFKSIEEAEIEFNPLTMIVGANASGKSNIINVFRFIENIMTDGIENAVALQGGIQYISNANLPKGEKIEIRFTIDVSNETWMRHLQNKKLALEVQEIDYKFIIQPNKKGGGYHIAYDYVKMSYDCYSFDSAAAKGEKYNSLNIQYATTFERKNQQASIKINHEIASDEVVAQDFENELKSDTACSYFAFVTSEHKTELMLYRLSMLLPPYFSENTFIRIFDFDPKELKRSSSMASTKMLEENGSNLASILQSILRKKEDSKKLTLLLNEFLPFIETVSVENNPDKSFSYKIRECYNNKDFYANFLSDGTVSILALIIALYFEALSNVIILEEPERNIHPKLLANLISSAEDIAKEKQVIITTHNPEFLKHANIDDVRLVSRDCSGKTKVSKPGDSTIVKEFMRNDLGLEELFLQGLLEE